MNTKPKEGRGLRAGELRTALEQFPPDAKVMLIFGADSSGYDLTSPVTAIRPDYHHADQVVVVSIPKREGWQERYYWDSNDSSA